MTLQSRDLDAAASGRVRGAASQIQNTMRMVAAGVPLAAEPTPERLKAVLKARTGMSSALAETMMKSIVASGHAARATPQAETAVAPAAGGPERIFGTVDFVGVAFLERGARASRGVARVAFRDGRPLGTGFMISDRLFVTNNHVIGAAGDAQGLVVEFDYERDVGGSVRTPSRFALDTNAFFFTEERDDLDFTLVAVGAKLDGPKSLSDFGWCAVSAAPDKHVLGEVANIIQHPDGRFKEAVLRENRLVSRLDTVLHYVADTETGSSGSPVFNNDWQVIALHHWGSPWRQKVDEQGRPIPTSVNEGIRASAIVQYLRGKRDMFNAVQRTLLQQALSLGESISGLAPSAAAAPSATTQPHVDAAGNVCWTIPVEVSVRLPGYGPAPAAAPAAVPGQLPPADPGVAEKIKPSDDFSDRGGYKASFIEGFSVPLPELSAGQKRDAARNREAEAGDDPFELKYHHFSVVVNRKRKLAFFAACNIDGSQAKAVDRNKGTVSPLDPDSPELESLGDAEASETWFPDDRLREEDYAGQQLYEAQIVPGFPDPRSMGRTERMFQRGHMVRRIDPAWGRDTMALKAEADTFHFTNAAPQVGFFNMGSAGKLRIPHTGGGRLWRSVENHVLRNAAAERLRVCSFTGPVFGDDDPPWRTEVIEDFKVPLRFWKIAVWAENGGLRSLAMLADQKPVLDAIGELPEAATDEEAFDQVGRVKDFLSTIAEVERLTGLDFGAAVRGGDIRAGERSHEVSQPDEIEATLSTRGRGGTSGRASARRSASRRRNRKAR
jgi:endonuclease G